MNDGRARSGRAAPSLASRRVLLSAIVATSAIGGMFLLAASLAGFSRTLDRLRNGDPAWLAAGTLFELLSIGGYAALFWSVVARDVPRLGWRASVEIPLAGIAALRLLATGGAGGFAVTAWALSRAGMAGREIGARLVAVVVVQYAVYMLAVIVCGVGLWAGLFAGGGSSALTITPAALSAGLILVVLGLAALSPRGPDSQLGRWPARRRLVTRPSRARVSRWLTTAMQTLRCGIRSALQALAAPRLDLRKVGLLGAIAYWGFDVAVLWCSFRAFGAPPAVAVVVMGYFLGTLGGLLPLPLGVGGIEGGMIGVFIAFAASPARSIVAVLAYRLISFWLPTLPGIAGYLGLRKTVRGWEVATSRDEHDGGCSEARRA